MLEWTPSSNKSSNKQNLSGSHASSVIPYFSLSAAQCTFQPILASASHNGIWYSWPSILSDNVISLFSRIPLAYSSGHYFLDSFGDTKHIPFSGPLHHQDGDQTLKISGPDTFLLFWCHHEQSLMYFSGPGKHIKWIPYKIKGEAKAKDWMIQLVRTQWYTFMFRQFITHIISKRRLVKSASSPWSLCHAFKW